MKQEKQISVKDKLISGTFWNVLGTGGRLLLAIGGSVVFVRYLKEDNYGIAVYLTDTSFLAVVIGSLGLGTFQAKTLPRLKIKKSLGEYKYLLKHNFLIRVVAVAIVSAIFFLIFSKRSSHSVITTYLFFFIIFSIFQVIISSIKGILLIEYQQKFVNILDVVSLLLRIIFVVPVIILDLGLFGFLITEVLVEIFQVLILFKKFNKDIWEKIYHITPKKYVGDIFSISLVLLFVDFSSIILSKEFDIFILGIILSDNIFSGITLYALSYAFIIRIFSFLGLGTAQTATLFISSMTELAQNGRHDTLAVMIEKQIKALVFFIFPIAVGGSLIGGKILIILYGQSFVGKEFIVATLFLAYGIYSFVYISKPALYALGMEKKIMYMRSSLILCKISLLFLLVPRFGITGILLISSTTITAIGIIELIVLKNKVNIKIPWIDLIKILVAVIGMATPVIVFNSVITEISVVNILSIFCLAVFTYIIFLSFLKPIAQDEYEIIVGSLIAKKLHLSKLIKIFVYQRSA